jgi:hypothetical protein
MKSNNATVPATASAPSLISLPTGASAWFAGIPPGQSPDTYQIDWVTSLLREAAYFSIFSMPNAATPNVPIPSPLNPSALIGVEVHEDLHRFDIQVEPPTPRGRIPARKRIGEPVAHVQINWMVIPDDFQAAPGLYPPPTELDPTRSQRFAMLDGRMSWLDRGRSGFRAFGTGRTFPDMVGSTPQSRIGAVIDILEGFGQFQQLQGAICVNGYITPPQGLALNLILRFLDPQEKLRASSSLAPLQEIGDPDPDTVFLTFLGEVDPAKPTTLQQIPSGVRASVHERLRLMRIEFDIGSSHGIRCRTTEGQIVATLSGTLLFNPFDPNQITPVQTTVGVFTFFDQTGCVIATLRANIAEGRGFRTQLPGAPGPIFRFGGFGPFLGGTGVFQNAVGMMSLNAAISVFPRTLSNLYALRISDPDGRFRTACSQAWS